MRIRKLIAMLIVCAMVFTVPVAVNAADAPIDTIGAADFSSGWWGDWSAGYEVPDGSTVTVQFNNKSSGAANWNNFVIGLASTQNAAHVLPNGVSGYTEYAVVRADAFYFDNTAVTCSTSWGGDWETFLATTKDSKVTAAFTREVGEITVDITIEGANGVTLYEQYVVTTTMTSESPLYFFLTVDGCYLELLSVTSAQTETFTITPDPSAIDVLGTTDYVLGWWTDWTDSYELVDGATATIKMNNYGSGANVWNNFLIALTNMQTASTLAPTVENYSGYAEYAVIRADAFDLKGNTTFTTSWGTDMVSYNKVMKDAEVTIVLTREAGTVTLDMTYTGSDGTALTNKAVVSSLTAEDPCHFFVTGENAYIEILSVDVVNPDTGDDDTTDDGTTDDGTTDDGTTDDGTTDDGTTDDGTTDDGTTDDGTTDDGTTDDGTTDDGTTDDGTTDDGTTDDGTTDDGTTDDGTTDDDTTDDGTTDDGTTDDGTTDDGTTDDGTTGDGTTGGETVDPIDTIGTSDKAMGFWGDWSDGYELADGKVVTVKFNNYSDGAANWDNFVLALVNTKTQSTLAPGAANYPGYAEYAVIRADAYGWGDASYKATFTTSWGDDWASWLELMKDAEVTMVLTRDGGTVTADMTFVGADGTTVTRSAAMTEKAVINSTMTADSPVYFFLTGEKCYIELLSVTTADAPEDDTTDDDTTEDDTTDDDTTEDDTTDEWIVDSPSWWAGHSAPVVVTTERQSWTFNTTTYADATDNWHTPTIVVWRSEEGAMHSATYLEELLIRSDSYAVSEEFYWGTAGEQSFNAKKYPADWAEWLAANKAGTTCTVTAQIANDCIIVGLTNNGVTNVYVVPYNTDTDSPVYLSVTGEKCTMTGWAETDEHINIDHVVSYVWGGEYTSGPSENPATGDGTNLIALTLATLMAGAGLAVTVVNKKKF